MNTQVEPPPKRGMGCFAKGCLILVAFGILVGVVGIGGTFGASVMFTFPINLRRSLNLLRHPKPAPPRHAWRNKHGYAERKKYGGSRTPGYDEASCARP